MIIIDMIKKGEGKNLEFKEKLPSSEQLAKTLVSFANMYGGRIIIGVADDGTIKGLGDVEPSEHLEKITNIVHDMIHPMIIPDVYSWSVEDKMLVVVEVFVSPLKPHFLKAYGKRDGTYVRVGAANKKADGEFIEELERQKRNITFDEDVYYEMELSDKVLEDLKSILKKNLNREIQNNDLLNLKLIKTVNNKEHLTNAVGILMGWFEYARVKCARFKGNSTRVFLDQKEYTGDIFGQVEDTMKFLKANINLHGEVGNDSIHRVDKYEIPLKALREAVLNALLHRDYSMKGSDIKVAVFDDIVEITSPGSFPRGITAEDVISGRSEIRNRVLARILKEANIIEQWGRGVKGIFDMCRENGNNPPAIKEAGEFVQIIFKRKGNVEEQERKKITNEKSGRLKVDEKSGRLKVEDFEWTENKTKQWALIEEYLKEKATIERATVMELLGIGKSRAVKILSVFVEAGLLKVEGAGRAVKYRMKEGRGLM